MTNMPQHNWTYLSLPGRHFSWRIRGNSLTWAFNQTAQLNQEYDVVLATSMTDLSSLRGMVPSLTRSVNILYFHENQFAYPQSGQSVHSVEPQVVSLYAALCADQLLFNSQYNCATFMHGVAALLKKLPDQVPKNIVAILNAKARVLPVPIEPGERRQRSPDGPLHIVWNHRWEYDKGPERLYSIVQHLPASLPLVFHVVGQGFRQQPPVFNDLHALLSCRDWLGEWGYVAQHDDYLSLLQRCDLVLSTAHHDFQGLAVLEAVAQGCVPLVPNSLAYPEWFPADYCYDNEQAEAAVYEALLVALQAKAQCRAVVPCIKHLYWSTLASQYQQILDGVNPVVSLTES